MNTKNIDIDSITIRTFGWIQDPGKLENLKKTVQVFDKGSKMYRELYNNIIPSIENDESIKIKLLDALESDPLKISYRTLVGTGCSDRKNAKCDGLIQASIPGQRRPYIADWPADNFVRWAHAFGFIKYNYEDDTFEITKEGLEYSKSTDESKEEFLILENAIISYPPAVRILGLLGNGEHLTKYEIAKNLGFIGEEGFTSLPQNILLETLALASEKKEKNKIKNDWDGSTDKYTRMISGWLEKIGLVKKIPKSFTFNIGNEVYTETISHAYKITSNGLKALRRAQGVNKVERSTKLIFWEMLCSIKSRDKIYIRSRRSYIIKLLKESSTPLSLEKLKLKLQNLGFNDNEKTIQNDIQGLYNIGIQITQEMKGYKLKDNIQDFYIPKAITTELGKSELVELKDRLRDSLEFVSQDYLILLDLAFDGSQNRAFEMKTMELLVNEYGFKGLHLGGTNKPDGLAYTTFDENNFGVIIDTKAYSNGFNIPIAEADKMRRYVEENRVRDNTINPNEWWLKFPDNINEFYFLFISGKFIGEYDEKLKKIYRQTGNHGGVLNVVNLIIGAELIKSGKLKLEVLANKLLENKEVKFKLDK